MDKRDAEKLFREADGEWTRELVKAFGRDAANAQYEKRGRGEFGSALRAAYEARQNAQRVWEVSR